MNLPVPKPELINDCERQSGCKDAAQTRPPSACVTRQGERGTMIVELVIAMGILVAVMIPLSFSFLQEQRACRAYYYQAVAMEIVDGEMEVLRAGEWRAFTPGTHPYTVSARAATNLPPGGFLLTLEESRLRLEWLPEGKGRGGRVWRETLLK
ncbi:MAG: hypothetical protein M1608_18375 [Candidatus Omnitrophica bacterium]|nr:hypothetical protein [Candidatus Omnitrophota bacterium]